MPLLNICHKQGKLIALLKQNIIISSEIHTKEEMYLSPQYVVHLYCIDSCVATK
jgi:hypothetical protein